MKKEPKRPDGIPTDAVWNPKENEWELGKKNEKRKKQAPPIGEWKYWSEDGRLVCIANFDDEGNQHGVIQKFHTDGTVANSGEWFKGNRHGRFVHIRSEHPSNEHYPADKRTWRFEFDSQNNWSEENEQWYLKSGEECTYDGRPLSEAHDFDEFFKEATTENFIINYGQKCKIDLFKNEEEEEEEEDKKDKLVDPLDIKSMWGTDSAEVDAFLNFAPEHADSFSVSTYARPFETNIWHSLVSNPWGNYYEELAAVFMGSVQIGRFGDSDGIYATLFQQNRKEPTPNTVYLWNHELYYIDDVLATSLDVFAFNIAISAANEAQRVSKKVNRQAWTKLADKVNINWAISEGLEAAYQYDDENDEATEESGDSDFPSKERFRADLDSDQSVRRFFWRSQWIIQLLQTDSRRDWDLVKDCFRPSFNPEFNDENIKEWIKNGHDLPHSALYLLWRFFWFAQDDRLAECMNQYKNHPARIVRELVSFIEEINTGNAKIERIEDIFNVRKTFLEMNFAPEGSKNREEKSIAESVQLEANLNELEIIATQTIPQGVEAASELAWKNVNDKKSMDKLEHGMRTVPGYQLQWRVLDWLRHRGYERANQEMKQEAENVVESIAKFDFKLLQPFVISEMKHGDLFTAHMLLQELAKSPEMLDPRVKENLVSQLDVVEKYNHRRTIAVSALSLVAGIDLVPKVAALIDEFFAELEGKTDFDYRLSSIPWEDFLAEIARCLKSLAPIDGEHKILRKSICERMKKLADLAVSNYQMKLAADLIDALIAWKDYAVLPLIGKILRNSNDSPERNSVLLSIEKLASLVTQAEWSELFNFGFLNPAEHENSTTILYDRALRALIAAHPTMGEPLEPISQAYDDACELSNYGEAGWKEWAIVQCETVTKFPELATDSIESYLRAYDNKIRKAANSAFNSRGIAVPPYKVATWIDILNSEVSSGEELLDQVLSMLTDPLSIARSVPAGFFWDQPNEAAAPILAKIVDTELDDFKEPADGTYISTELIWLIKALAKHATVESTFKTIQRCMTHDNNDVSSTILNDDIVSFPVSFAPTLLKIAANDSGWRKARISQWAAKHLDHPELQAALKEQKITERKLKAWATV